MPGTINVSFADGHVEQVKLDELWSFTWSRVFVPTSKRPGLP
jgi:prepilin-type processing-associated H-X9-DG protein